MEQERPNHISEEFVRIDIGIKVEEHIRAIRNNKRRPAWIEDSSLRGGYIFGRILPETSNDKFYFLRTPDGIIKKLFYKNLLGLYVEKRWLINF